jgi:hypothetical protein
VLNPENKILQVKIVTEVICSEITMEHNTYFVACPRVTKEKLINEVRREDLMDPYSIDIPSIVCLK